MEQAQDYHISPNQLSIKFDGCSTIENIDKFIASHELFIANLKEGKARSAYKYRLDKVRKLIIEQDEQRN